MSTQGHSPQLTTQKTDMIVRRPSWRSALRSPASHLPATFHNRNIVRGAVAVFAGTMAIGYMLVPAPAFASKAKLTVEESAANNVIWIKGANFPSKATATVQTNLAGTKEEKKVVVRDGRFKIAVIRGNATAVKANDVVEAKAWTRGKSASVKKRLSTASPSNVNAFIPTTTTTAAPTTTTTAAPATTQPPTGAVVPKPVVTAPKPATTAAPAPAAASASGVPAGYKLVWSDEFNGGLDKSKWGVYEGSGNAGVGRRVASAVSTAGGALKITGSGTDGGGVGSSYKATYGYYEVRQRFDAGSIGYNTATLLWPTSENWPVDGEIDMVEIFNGATNHAGSYVHWGSGNSQLYNEYNGDFSQWHTWGVDWQADHITYYLDGKPFWNVTNPAAIPHNPHFIGLQLDVNPKGGQVSGSSFNVDYVRVYQK